MPEDLEQQRLDLERARLEGELRLRERELQLKQQELEAQRSAPREKGFSVSPVVATVIAATTGLLGTGLGTYLQGRSNIDLETKRFESQLILKAIETGDEAGSAKNLLFLIKAGFIADDKGTIKKIAEGQTDVPVLPKSGGFTTGEFHGVPPEGVGGDAQLNTLKNRDVAPTAYTPFSFADLAKNRPQNVLAMARRPRSEWSDTALNEVRVWETKGATVEGYLTSVRLSGPEVSNARMAEPDERNIHGFLVASMGASKESAVIVVVTPRVVASHPRWTVSALRQLVQQENKIRVSGWLLWNQYHPEQLGRSRLTLWEIHPVHKIEVFTNSQWTEF